MEGRILFSKNPSILVIEEHFQYPFHRYCSLMGGRTPTAWHWPIALGLPIYLFMDSAHHLPIRSLSERWFLALPIPVPW